MITDSKFLMQVGKFNTATIALQRTVEFMKQKGQGLVEFAVILPMLMFLTMSIIYGGAMFADFIQYNNAARDAARDISLKQAVDSRQTVITNINKDGSEVWKNYASPLTGLYTPTMHVDFIDSTGKTVTSEDNAEDIKVTIMLERTVNFSSTFEKFMVFPDRLPIVYKMKLEK